MTKYFKGNNIDLVPFEKHQVEEVRKWINDEKITLYMGARFPVGKIEQRIWYKNILKDKSKKKLIIITKSARGVGMVSLTSIDYKNQNAEIGVYISSGNHKQGYAKEAVLMMVNFAINELNMHKIYAFIHSSNIKSVELFRSIGFIRESIDIDAIYSNGKFIDVIKYSIFKKNINNE